MANNIVGITLKRVLWKVFLHPTIKHFVQVEVRQQWADHAALWCSFFSLLDITAWQLHSGGDPTLDIEVVPWIIGCLRNKTLELIVIQIIKESFDVQINDPCIVPAIDFRCLHGVMGAALRAIAERG